MAIALALSASVAWGASDFLGGLASRRLSVLAVLLPSQTVALAVVVVVVVGSSQPAPPLRYLVLAALAGVAATAGLAAFYRGMQAGDISVVAPISATAVVVPVLVGLASGDRLRMVEAAGMVAAIVGVFLVSRPDDVAKDSRRAAAGAGFGVLAALGIGTFFVAMDAASDAGVLWASLVHRGASVALIGAAVLVTRDGPRVQRGDLRLLVAIGFLDISANLAFGAASTYGYVSIVSVLASLYSLVTVALARLVLAERLASVQALGIAIALAGVALVSAG